jgi:hypothetical protein
MARNPLSFFNRAFFHRAFADFLPSAPPVPAAFFNDSDANRVSSVHLTIAALYRID